MSHAAFRSLVVAVLVTCCGCRPESPVPKSTVEWPDEPPKTKLTATVSPAVTAASYFPPGESRGHIWFQEMTEESGVTFRHVSGNSDVKPFPAANGSGLATFDFDRGSGALLGPLSVKARVSA